MSSLLAENAVNEDEKRAILNYLGNVESLDEDSIESASGLAENKARVIEALLDVLQKHDNKPIEDLPAQPVSEPQLPADQPLSSDSSESLAKSLVNNLMNGV